MFSHQLSGLCKFDKLCENKLCSFQHESECEDRFSCQESEFKFRNEKSLTKHVETEHDNKRMMMMNFTPVILEIESY